MAELMARSYITNFNKITILFLLFMSVSGCRESASTAVPRLIQMFSSTDTHERNSAAHEIGSYGKEAEEAVLPLIKLLHDPNNGVRSSAAYSLRRIGTKEASEALDSYKKD